jgi:two-component system probable response regulator PhcQ
MQHLLLVNDEVSILNAWQRVLRQHFGQLLTVTPCTSGAQALALAHRHDIVVSDLRMPGMDGVAFLRRFANVQPHSVRLMLTGSADFASGQRAVNETGIYRYLTKPWVQTDLLQHLQDALIQFSLAPLRAAGAPRTGRPPRPPTRSGFPPHRPWGC